jgi:hypothetical protein
MDRQSLTELISSSAVQMFAFRFRKLALLTLIFSFLLTMAICADRSCAQLDFEAKPICYETAPTSNAIDKLEKRLESGELELVHDNEHGYLKSLLDALEVPASSQMLVFSKTSFQLRKISKRRPRAVYFNDDVYLGWVQRGDVIEISTADDNLGAVFYTLSQEKTARPKFIRDRGQCMSCHSSSKTLGVPGHLVRSVFAKESGQPKYGSGTFTIDHRSDFKNRWGGWFVSGTHGDQRHMGNVAAVKKDTSQSFDRETGANTTDLTKFVDTSPYLGDHSDIVALMVLEHQTRMHNLITRANFETRAAHHSDVSMNKIIGRPDNHRTDTSKRRIASAAAKLVQYMLYSEEHLLTDKINGISGFAKEFTAQGPFDQKGRTLREFDLETRMMKYPCSHLIYSSTFDKLPAEMLDAVYLRLFAVLSGEDDSAEFEHLSAADRTAIFEILSDTKKNLPDYWITGEQTELGNAAQQMQSTSKDTVSTGE